jgi:hypothetical protein
MSFSDPREAGFRIWSFIEGAQQLYDLLNCRVSRYLGFIVRNMFLEKLVAFIPNIEPLRKFTEVTLHITWSENDMTGSG